MYWHAGSASFVALGFVYCFTRVALHVADTAVVFCCNYFWELVPNIRFSSLTFFLLLTFSSFLFFSPRLPSSLLFLSFCCCGWRRELLGAFVTPKVWGLSRKLRCYVVLRIVTVSKKLRKYDNIYSQICNIGYRELHATCMDFFIFVFNDPPRK